MIQPNTLPSTCRVNSLVPLSSLPAAFQPGMPARQGTALSSQTVGEAGGLATPSVSFDEALPRGPWETRTGTPSRRSAGPSTGCWRNLESIGQQAQCWRAGEELGELNPGLRCHPLKLPSTRVTRHHQQPHQDITASRISKTHTLASWWVRPAHISHTLAASSGTPGQQQKIHPCRKSSRACSHCNTCPEDSL